MLTARVRGTLLDLPVYESNACSQEVESRNSEVGGRKDIVVADEPIVGEPEEARERPLPRPRAELDQILDMIWPETGLQTGARVSRREKDALGEDDLVELEIDFVTLSLSPLEFIQLASFLRMTVDGLLERHPGLQRAVVNAFDIRE
jgi:hypothetical protein